MKREREREKEGEVGREGSIGIGSGRTLSISSSPVVSFPSINTVTSRTGTSSMGSDVSVKPGPHRSILQKLVEMKAMLYGDVLRLFQ